MVLTKWHYEVCISHEPLTLDTPLVKKNGVQASTGGRNALVCFLVWCRPWCMFDVAVHVVSLNVFGVVVHVTHLSVVLVMHSIVHHLLVPPFVHAVSVLTVRPV
jgi:hypothetical protein